MNALYINSAIDFVQNAKTTFLKTFVKDEAFLKPAQDFVDAQTTFAKAVAKSADSFVKAASSYDYKNLFNVAK